MKLFDKINQATVDYAHEPVPNDKRRGFLSLWSVWFVTLVNIAFFFFGFEVANKASFFDAFIALILAQIILGALGGLTAAGAAQSGLNAASLVNQSYGVIAGKIIAAIIGLSLLGWFGFQLEVFANYLADVLGLGQDLIRGVIILCGLFMLTSAVIGFRAVAWLSQLAAPLLIILLFSPIAMYIWQGGNLSDLTSERYITAEKQPFGTLLGMFLGGAASLLIVAADIMRYGRNAKQAFAVTFSAQLVFSTLIFSFAFLIGRIYAGTDFMQIIGLIAPGVLGFVLLYLATWTTNDTNIYISSLAFSGIFKSLRKWVIAILCGLIGIGVAVSGLVVTHFMTWLVLLGVFFGPAAAPLQIEICRALLRGQRAAKSDYISSDGFEQ